MSHIDEEELLQLIVKTPVDTYKTTLRYASNIPEIGIYQLIQYLF